jgi:hypothetical protein
MEPEKELLQKVLGERIDEIKVRNGDFKEKNGKEVKVLM